MSSGALAFVIIGNESSTFSLTGVSPQSPPIQRDFAGQVDWDTLCTGGVADATARWEFGNILPLLGTYQFDAFIPNNTARAAATRPPSISYKSPGGSAVEQSY